MDDTEMTTSGVTDTIASPAKESDADAVLVRQYLSGDNHAFEVLFKKYQAPVFNIVNRMVNGEDAYDLTQDIFCNALRALPSFRGDSKFSTWLYSIAKNACLNQIRRINRAREDSLEAMAEDQPYTELADESVDVEATAETHEMQSIVNRVLASMPDDQRLLITLRDFEQLSYDEIGIITGMSLPTVKSRLHRARMVFKNKFRPYLASTREGSR
ncbi:MAG: RNA polymerase sigma factor [Armatimonadota bacterium]